MSARLVVLAVAAVSALVAVIIVVTVMLGPRGDRTGSAVPIGGPFVLVDHTGVERTPTDFAAGPMLIYFGYTYCPDVCPTELQKMVLALDELGEAGAAITPLLITVDPERDTVAQLAQYVPLFHERLVGLTGSPEQVTRAAKAYRIYYARREDQANSDYLMDHSSFIYLMDKENRYLAHFGPQESPESIARRIRALL